MTADQRVIMAREFLASVRPHKISDRPHSVLVREAAELRRQLGQVLDVIGDGGALSPADLVTVRAALADAEQARKDSAESWCSDCEAHPAGACESHVDDLDQAAAYQALAGRLGGEL